MMNEKLIYLIPHGIDRSAEHFPDKEAFRFSGQSLTYAQLVRRSNALARMLQEQGVTRRDRVGIYLNKSLESAVSVYGIMKAGAAYVPLDPLAPVSRLAFVLQDCQIRHLVSEEGKRANLQAMAQDGVALDSVVGLSGQNDLPFREITWADVEAMPGESPPQVTLVEHDLAYIMYTSGSTGTPKGLMHTHYSGLSYAQMSISTYDVDHQDKLSNHSPLHFDMSTFDYFSGPIAGATTVIIPEEYTKLPASLSKLMETEGLTIWYSVPFALIQLLLRGVLEERDLSRLRWVLFGGEPFPPKHLRALMAKWPQARFSNVYGPAEVNQCTYYHVPPIPEDSDEQIPIGQMCDDAEGLVVDADDQAVSPGQVGELLVRAPTMMRGYWGRPELNQKVFYRRSVFPDYEEVFLRTGDLVRLRQDGKNYDFLGRKDRQIKTRGYRVELDEIEAALLSHAGVEEAAAFAVPDSEGSQQIEAAIILKTEAAQASLDLTKHVSGLLPWYAVPGKINVLGSFPRTTSGKIDRRRLREQAMEELLEQNGL
jgi:amino acid adenylation domain-containing protein